MAILPISEKKNIFLHCKIHILFATGIMKTFNITGICNPNEHYMADITGRLEIINKMVAKGDYFCINRGRQYGKSTTLNAVKSVLEKEEYTVFSLSFEELGDNLFSSDEKLCASVMWLIKNAVENDNVHGLSEKSRNLILDAVDDRIEPVETIIFSNILSKVCRYNERPVVLTIDEIDSASNHSSFIRFLAILRNQFLGRKNKPTFKSVILAGVHDIKNLKIRPEGEHIPNSPWNIASPFDVDMSLSEDGIRGMLEEYEADRRTGMNVAYIAAQIRKYTNGYPFLVSRLCMLMDEQGDWSREGFFNAEKCLLKERNTFFDNINKKLDEYPEMRMLLRAILFNGKRIAYNSNVLWQEVCLMYGYLRMEGSALVIDNRIVETMLYNKFVDEEQLQNLMYNQGCAAQMNYTKDGCLDMEHILAHFCTSFEKIYGKETDEFVEAEGRRLFMMYMRPVINGLGHFYVEAQTRDMTRTDLIIDYLGQQYIIEMKIWHGNSYNERGEKQLAAYMDYYDVKKAYMLSFCFTKNKRPGVLPPVRIGERTLIEAIV